MGGYRWGVARPRSASSQSQATRLPHPRPQHSPEPLAEAARIAQHVAEHEDEGEGVRADTPQPMQPSAHSVSFVDNHDDQDDKHHPSTHPEPTEEQQQPIADDSLLDLDALTPRSRMLAVEPWLQQIRDRHDRHPPPLQAAPGSASTLCRPSSQHKLRRGRSGSYTQPTLARHGTLTAELARLNAALAHEYATPGSSFTRSIGRPMTASDTRSLRHSSGGGGGSRASLWDEQLRRRTQSAGRIPSWKEYLPEPPPPSPTSSRTYRWVLGVAGSLV